MLTDRFTGTGLATGLQRYLTANGDGVLLLGLAGLGLAILLIDYGKMLYLRSKMVPKGLVILAV